MDPDPFTPADCDLRGLQYMPLFGDRLFGSATWIAASAEGKVAALRLWWRAYAHEVPAASLPDDDALLADYAGYGVGVKAWRKVRPQAMRGWVRCSDGRLYHRTVAEIALESWATRLRNRKKQADWRSKNRPVPDEVTPDVTVTGEVTEPFRNAGAGQGRAGQGIDVTTTSSGVGNGAQARRHPTQVPDEFREKALAGRAKRLPDGWQPDAELVAWAQQRRADLTEAEIARQVERFVLHARDKGRVSHDWSEAFRLWIDDARGKFDAGPASESWEDRRLREGREKLAEMQAKGIL